MGVSSIDSKHSPGVRPRLSMNALSMALQGWGGTESCNCSSSLVYTRGRKPPMMESTWPSLM